MKNIIRNTSLAILVAFTFNFAGEWHPVHESGNSMSINSIASRSIAFDLQIAVGDNGNVYRSWEAGRFWDFFNAGTGEHLTDVVIFFDGSQDVAIAVGDNGTIVRSYDFGDSWEPLDAGTPDNLTSVVFDEANQIVWIAGANSTMHYSEDYGDSWNFLAIENTGLYILDMVWDWDGLFIVGEKNDSSFVHRIQDYQVPPFVQFSVGDTIPFVKLSSLYYNLGQLFAGGASQIGDSYIYSRFYSNGLGPNGLVNSFPQVHINDIDVYRVTTPDTIEIIWFTTNEGEIWESRNAGGSFNLVYKDLFNRPINTILTDKSSAGSNGQAVAAGFDELILRYSFELYNIMPYKNDNLSFPVNRLEMNFSGVSDLNSVDENVIISSSFSGNVPFWSERDLIDSNTVFLNISRAIPPESIPGEKWNISVGDSIRQLFDDSLPGSFSSFNYDVNFMPFTQGSLNLEPSTSHNLFQKPTTNFVTGFFNDDEILDLATFDGDTLYVFELDESGVIGNFRSIAMLVGGMVDPSIKDQLILADLNKDGRQDIIFYDSNFITSFINQAIDPAYDFAFSGNIYNSPNIKHVQIFNGNNNSSPDMMILNDSLHTRMDITDFNFGWAGYILELGGAINQRMKLADIDVDGWVDLVSANSDGSISYYHGQGGGFFDVPLTYSDGAPYRDVFIADFDDDKRLEILALKDDEFDLYTIDFDDTRNLLLHPLSPLQLANPQFIEDVVLHDFGGAISQNADPAQIDIAIVSIDNTLKFFENINFQDGGISFVEREDKERGLDIVLNGLIHWDGNADANLDILTFDRFTGDIQNVINKNWSPIITNVFIEPGGVRVNWNRFSEGQGNFEYYRLYRESWDHGRQNIQPIDFFNIDDTTYLDMDTDPLEHYDYWIEIGFDGQIVTNPNRFGIELVTFINGPLMGTFDDTTIGYVVDTEINVPFGETLIIGEGVQFGFSSGAVFDVFGSLFVQGSEENMIEFRPYSQDSIFVPWRGIRAHPGADTVSFSWSDIGGADTAIVANRRPLDIRKGGIGRNGYGIVSIGDTLTVENIIVDSNWVGISVENSKATIKNVNALFNQQYGISVSAGGSAKTRNSIIWGNENMGVNVSADASFSISYSTMDMINGPNTQFEVNRFNPPLFLNFDAEDDSNFYYQPDPLSPTVDAGDPADDFSLEPMPNGGRINQGLLGGLKLATQSIRPKLVVTPDQIFPMAKIGETDTIHFEITNEGVLNLEISSINLLATEDVFSFTNSAIAGLAPGETVQHTLYFSPEARKEYIDTLLIFSNDPTYPIHKTPIMALGENAIPQLLQGPELTARVGEEYRYRIQTRDDDNDNVSIVVNQRPSWLIQEAADDFRGTPTMSDIGTDTLSFDLRDSFGAVRPYIYPIIVFQDNIVPQFELIPDTTIYSNVQFYYQWNVVDLDGDVLDFSDNTSLFDIHPDSGFIAFTPQISDTGNYQIEVSASDGIQTVVDSFNLQIDLNLLNAAQNLVLTAQDQAIDVSFTLPVNGLYTSTRILLSSDGAIVSPNQNALTLDTVLTGGANVQFRIVGLEINTVYNIAVYNYFESDGTIYSQPLTGSIATLAPAVEIDGIDFTIDLPVNQKHEGQILVRNNGGGSLITRFGYKADSLLDVWFDMDTTEHTVAPFDSVYIDYQLHPNKQLPRNRTYDVIAFLESNDPTDQEYMYSISMNPIFDDFNPNIVITARPDSIVRQSAISIHFYADDISDYPIGDPEESLLYHYRFIKGVSNPEILDSRDSIRTNSLTFYPLDDGFYTLRIWASDTEGNQKGQSKRRNIYFFVNATSKTVFRNRWQMISIPRPVEVAWADYVQDSLLQIYRWNNAEDSYLPVHSSLDQEYNIGQAVWVISANKFPINLSRNQADVDSSYSTPVEVGWNQIGAPISYVTGWGNMTFTTAAGDSMSLTEAAESDLVSPVVYWYQYDLEDYGWQDIENAVAVPWRGYWLKSEVEGTLGFSTVAVDTFRNAITSPVTLPKGTSGLTFNISLKTDENGDRYNVFGIATGNKLKDVQEPPQIGSYSSLYFQHNNKRLTRKIFDDFESAEDIKTWQAVVESRSANKTHILNWDAEQIKSSGLFFFLVDLRKEVIVEMNKENSYTFKPSEGKRNFKIYASQDESYKPEIIPVTFRLAPNFPNPFNPSTTIRFGVPENMVDQKVKITIYNVLGQEVLQLFNKSFESGYHEVKWHGQNSYGQKVSSGVYFYKLISGNSSLARKMILLR